MLGSGPTDDLDDKLRACPLSAAPYDGWSILRNVNFFSFDKLEVSVSFQPSIIISHGYDDDDRNSH
jgi:hypothetical protein